MNTTARDLEDHFAFGKNWRRFLEQIDEERIGEATAALTDMLGTAGTGLEGLRFLDAGSGSGLMSLAAHRLGARVFSFDLDPESVACTRTLHERAGSPPNWRIESGSVLDRGFVSALGEFDIVYSWGVLHHTGALWDALDIAASAVAPGGLFFIAIYNDQGRRTRVWSVVKRLYVRVPALRPLLLGIAAAGLLGPVIARDTVRGTPLAHFRSYGRRRGMAVWTDLVDWVGGWPFEAATPEAVFDFCSDRGLVLERLRTTQGLGCNEFVFRRL